MATLINEDNCRRLSSNISNGGGPAIEEDQCQGPTSRCCCCGCSNRSSKPKSDKKCTAARVKSCLKLFFAQVFSHVGLCALVVGYSIMGAFIFGYLEKDNEQQTRDKVRDVRRQTLDQLYDITERLNVLYHENWTAEAGVVLRRFEQEVIRKAKSEGYDGQSNSSQAQWSFSGALLYSVTVITTIGYGNIAPKTNWGRIVTMFYAIFGMPLFLMWASQMGTFLAQTFQFIYSNVCCALCRAGKKRRAAQAAAKLKKQETLKTIFLDRERDLDRDAGDGSIVKMMPSDVENGRSFEEQKATNLINLSTPAHHPNNGVDPLANDKSIRIEILEPDVKELLSSCALYNLDQESGDMDSGEVLEEIRHAEALLTIRNNASASSSKKSSCNEATPQYSPLRLRLNPDIDRDPSQSEASEPSSPSLLVKTNFDSFGSGASPLAIRRARLAHQTVVSMGSASGTPVTTLIRSVKPVKSREPSPASSYQACNINIGLRAESIAGIGSVDSIHRNATSKLQPEVIINQDRVPILPVLAFVFGYIMLGATIFSAWEKWSFLEGAYFSFITLTTIGFGDFVPGDAVLNDESEHGQAKLILACIYLLMGLAIVAMSINLVQEEIVEKIREFARDVGLVDDEDDDSVQIPNDLLHYPA